MIIALLLGTIIWATLTQLSFNEKPFLSSELRQYLIMAIIFLLVLPALIGFGKVEFFKEYFQPFLSGLFLGELFGTLITWFRTKKTSGLGSFFSSKKSSKKSKSKTK